MKLIAKGKYKKPINNDVCDFFKIAKNRISHIGIYLTNGFFIHSSVKKGVTVSNLNEEYYQKYFYSGGRIE